MDEFPTLEVIAPNTRVYAVQDVKRFAGLLSGLEMIVRDGINDKYNDVSFDKYLNYEQRKEFFDCQQTHDPQGETDLGADDSRRIELYEGAVFNIVPCIGNLALNMTFINEDSGGRHIKVTDMIKSKYVIAPAHNPLGAELRNLSEGRTISQIKAHASKYSFEPIAVDLRRAIACDGSILYSTMLIEGIKPEEVELPIGKSFFAYRARDIGGFLLKHTLPSSPAAKST